jgi:AcrR family transcriptional regulator
MSTSDPEVKPAQVTGRRVSRQREAGAVTRRETRRRVLAAATEEFAERGYAGATVARIADRADVAVQTVYHAWGSKQAMLRAMLEQAITDHDAGFEPNRDLREPLAGDLDPADAADPERLLAHIAHRFAVLADRAAIAWQTYRDAAGVDPVIAAEWQQLQEIRRSAFDALIGRLPAGSLRPGLTQRRAADTAWVIASPESYELLVRRAGLTTAELEQWVGATLTAALLP